MATYQELLKDPRWQRKRLEIMERADFTCESCEEKEKTLHIHHNYYEKNKKPWEYPDDSLQCLCEDCHEKIGTIKKAFNEIMKDPCMYGNWEEIYGFALARYLDAKSDYDEDAHFVLKVHNLGYRVALGLGRFYKSCALDIVNYAQDKGYINASGLACLPDRDVNYGKSRRLIYKYLMYKEKKTGLTDEEKERLKELLHS